tara:strand:+ start:234 stop:482 length:249 start_codon:yes stop_codon:yes gene_type:complete
VKDLIEALQAGATQPVDVPWMLVHERRDGGKSNILSMMALQEHVGATITDKGLWTNIWAYLRDHSHLAILEETGMLWGEEPP